MAHNFSANTPPQPNLPLPNPPTFSSQSGLTTIIAGSAAAGGVTTAGINVDRANQEMLERKIKNNKTLRMGARALSEDCLPQDRYKGLPRTV